jgi:hypothetical protein
MERRLLPNVVYLSKISLITGQYFHARIFSLNAFSPFIAKKVACTK